MANFDLNCIEFLDLSDVEEREKYRILQTVRTWDESVKVPWKPGNVEKVQFLSQGCDSDGQVGCEYQNNGKNLVLPIQHEVYHSGIPQHVYGVPQYGFNDVQGYEGVAQGYSYSDLKYQGPAAQFTNMGAYGGMEGEYNRNLVNKVVFSSNNKYPMGVDNSKACFDVKPELTQTYNNVPLNIANGDVKMYNDCYSQENNITHNFVHNEASLQSHIVDYNAEQNNTQIRENNFRNVDSNIRNVENKSRNIENKTKNVESNTRNVEGNKKNVEINTINVESSTKNIENNTKNVVIHSRNVESSSRNVESNTRNVERNLRNENNTKATVASKDIITPNNDVKTSSTEVVAENETQVPKKPERKSWASLFGKSDPGNANDASQKPSVTITTPNCNKPRGGIPSHLKKIPPHLDDPNYYRMSETLAQYNIDNKIISLQPRGLINKSNYCYINSVLQALLACPPIYNLLTDIAQHCKNDTENKKGVPVIENMCRFIQEFHHLPASLRVGRRSDKNQKKEHVPINCEPPFEPNWIYKMLNGIRSDSFIVEGVQEDAEEFLGCVLNGLNDEMTEILKITTKTTSSKQMERHESNEDEWQVMGPKNKGCVTRKTENVKTPIVDILGGQLRSRVYRSGDQSTDNIQPFFTLQLNIENASTVYEALESLVSKNQLEGVTSSKTNEEVEAWQQVMIEELPIVLILHLKCFNFKEDGCTKVIKSMDFPVDLKIDSKLLSSKKTYTVKEKQYKLFAVVCHDGKEISKGHYITDAYHVGYASWLRYDDASVKSISEEQVLKPQGTRVPYLLFYRRSDSVRIK